MFVKHSMEDQMKRKHFSEEQIVTVLKRVDGGESPGAPRSADSPVGENPTWVRVSRPTHKRATQSWRRQSG